MAHIAFPLSEALRERTEALITALCEDEQPTQYAKELVDVITLLADEGLGFFFIKSLKHAGIGGLTLMAVETALSSGKKAVLYVGKKIIMGMSAEQLRRIGESMREMFLDDKKEA